MVALSPPEALPVSAPARVAEHLRTAPDGPVKVLHHTPSALYVEVAGRCVGVVAPNAAQVPCALRVAASALGVSPSAVLATEPVSPYVERGTLYLTGHPLRIGRFVDVRVPRIDIGRVLGRAASPANAVARPPRSAADGLAAHSAGADGRALAAPVLPRPAADGLAAHSAGADGRALAAPVLPRPAADGLAAHSAGADGRALAAPVRPRPAADGLAAHSAGANGRALAAPVLPRPAADGLAAHSAGADGRALAAPVLPRPAADGLAAHSAGADGRALAAPVLPRPAADGLAAHSAASALEELPALPPRIDASILRALVGNGGGLTPLGDDVLCGWLAVLVAADRLTDVVAAAVREVLDRTTVLSATLVECALHGEVLPEFAAYLAALGTPAEDDAVRALTRIGHTSGAGLWWGARHAMTTFAMEEAA